MIALNELRKGDNQLKVYESLQQLRLALSIENNPPISKAVEFGFVPLLIHYLGSKNLDIQLQSASILTIICSGSSSDTQSVVNCGAVPLFISLLAMKTNLELCEQIVWTLGNIAGDSISNRNFLNSLNLFNILLQFAIEIPLDSRLTLQRNIVWTLSNLFRGKPFPMNINHNHALALLIFYIYSNDEDTVQDALWGLSYFTDSNFELVDQVVTILHPFYYSSNGYFSGIDKNLIEFPVDLKGFDKNSSISSSFSPSILSPTYSTSNSTLIPLKSYHVSYENDEKKYSLSNGNCHFIQRLLYLISLPNNSNLISPILRCIGDIIVSSDLHQDLIIRSGWLTPLISLLSHQLIQTNLKLRRQLCLIYSNISSGISSNISAFLSTNIFPTLIQLSMNDNILVSKEILWVISNLSSSCTDEQCNYLISSNCLEPLVFYLKENDNKIQIISLTAIKNLLIRKPKETTTAIFSLEEDVIDSLNNLFHSKNPEISHFSKNILLILEKQRAKQENVVNIYNQFYHLKSNEPTLLPSPPIFSSSTSTPHTIPSPPTLVSSTSAPIFSSHLNLNSIDMEKEFEKEEQLEKEQSEQFLRSLEAGGIKFH